MVPCLRIELSYPEGGILQTPVCPSTHGMAEVVGFEPTVAFTLLVISSDVL